jgi:hypothetical protein
MRLRNFIRVFSSYDVRREERSVDRSRNGRNYINGGSASYGEGFFRGGRRWCGRAERVVGKDEGAKVAKYQWDESWWQDVVLDVLV